MSREKVIRCRQVKRAREAAGAKRELDHPEATGEAAQSTREQDQPGATGEATKSARTSPQRWRDLPDHGRDSKEVSVMRSWDALFPWHLEDQLVVHRLVVDCAAVPLS